MRYLVTRISELERQFRDSVLVTIVVTIWLQKYDQSKGLPMNVPVEIRQCVMYVGSSKKSGGFKPQGTAFMVRYTLALEGEQQMAQAFLVTAKHVIEDASADDFEGKIRLRANLSESGEAQTMSTEVEHIWRTHPTDESIDVAIMAWPEKWKVVEYSDI